MSIKVKLEVIGEGPFIKAPDFCPYKTVESKPDYHFSSAEIISRVNSSLCPLCKKCSFYVDDIAERGLSLDEKHKLIKYFTEFNSKLANSISGQHMYLTKENRLPVAILIGLPTLEQALQYACNNDHKRITEIKNYIIAEEKPICFLMGCPMYLNAKLAQTPIQVVGEISWK